MKHPLLCIVRLLGAAMVCVLLGLASPVWGKTRTVKLSDYGILPNAPTDKTLSARLDSVMRLVVTRQAKGEKLVLRLQRGAYHLHGTTSKAYELYISNHDQNQPKHVGLMLDGLRDVTIDGGGAELICHGRMLPIVLRHGRGVTLKRLTIDFDNPQIAQIQIVKNSPTEGITFEVAPWVRWRIGANGHFETYGDGWVMQQSSGIAFEPDTRHIVYRTGDLGFNSSEARDLGGGHVLAPQWRDDRLKPGTFVALRGWARPCPGLFMAHDTATVLHDVTIHYAEGMGLLAQRCHDIELKGFRVALRGKDDPRYFTTQADATHFSQCSGHIASSGGLYENMMDDAINVHGVYLRLQQVVDGHTLRAGYEHSQAYGFDWGCLGDTVCLLRSATMEEASFRSRITAIRPLEGTSYNGVKELLITLSDNVPAEVAAHPQEWGIENLTATPTVSFHHNIVRNNRARGALFSSPRRTLCENNLFDHVSGSAIVLCGDCNGWYESGAVRDLVIRRNTFVHALTTLYQFTNAVISIYPEIPRLSEQQACFHGGRQGAIRIENNYFEHFDKPLLYAKSVDGLTFRDNHLKQVPAFEPYHFIQREITLEKCERADVEPCRVVK